MPPRALPHEYLDRSGSLSPEELRKLQDWVEETRYDAGTGETVYELGARPIWGGYQLTVTVNAAQNAYQVKRREHCQCQEGRHALDCECIPVDCVKCHLRLTGLTNICDSELCLYDQCPACRHYRETCFSEEIIAAVLKQADIEQSHSSSEAMAMVFAVAENLGAHTGEAPVFPITERAIDLSERLASRTGEGRNTVWTFQDQSTLTPDRTRGIWLEAHD